MIALLTQNSVHRIFTEEASEPIMQPMLSSVLKKVRNSFKIRCFSG